MGKLSVANRKCKDTVFHRLFSENKENALSLYNALNGTDYSNTDELTYTTLEEAVFMSYKEDCAFIVSRTLNLYEHQSTINPNMPLRGLIYFSKIYQDLIEPQSKLYSSTRMYIPKPKYVVFYNGSNRKDQDDVIKLRLSDMFMDADLSGEFEWTATMININEGHSQEIKKDCSILNEYAIFIDEVRKQSKEHDFNTAMHLAVDICIEKGVLADFLRKHRSEVEMDILTEFDEEEYKEMVREEGREEGVLNSLKNLMSNMHFTVDQAMEALGISAEDKQKYSALLSK